MSTLLKVDMENPVAKNEQDKLIQGLLIGDKVGDIYFLNLKNLPKLPSIQKNAPEKKEEEEGGDSAVAKLIYGHMQSCTSI